MEERQQLLGRSFTKKAFYGSKTGHYEEVCGGTLCLLEKLYLDK
jgi:hypothetical protein